MTKTLVLFEEWLRCPKCRGKLNVNQERNSITCQMDSSHDYPIEDNIPRFVQREEISPEDAKWIFNYDESADQYDQALEFYNELLKPT